MARPPLPGFVDKFLSDLLIDVRQTTQMAIEGPPRRPELIASANEAPRQPLIGDNAGVRLESYSSRAEARAALHGDLGAAANRFFKGATGKSRGFKISSLASGTHRFEFFSPANNPGYGKLYVQEVNSEGVVLRRFKDTVGPNGLIERKWMSR